MYKCTSRRQFSPHFRTRQIPAFSQTTRAIRTERWRIRVQCAVTWYASAIIESRRITWSKTISHFAFGHLRTPSVALTQRFPFSRFAVVVPAYRLGYQIERLHFALSFAFHAPIRTPHIETPCPTSPRIKSVSAKRHERMNYGVFRNKANAERTCSHPLCSNVKYSPLRSQSVMARASARNYFNIALDIKLLVTQASQGWL